MSEWKQLFLIFLKLINENFSLTNFNFIFHRFTQQGHIAVFRQLTCTLTLSLHLQPISWYLNLYLISCFAVLLLLSILHFHFTQPSFSISNSFPSLYQFQSFTSLPFSLSLIYLFQSHSHALTDALHSHTLSISSF